MSDKQYVNSIWVEEKTFDDGGSILKLNVKAEELIKFLKDNKNKDGFVKLVIAKKRTIEAGKSTHYTYLDNWQPTGQSTQTATKPTPVKKTAPKSVQEEQEENFI